MSQSGRVAKTLSALIGHIRNPRKWADAEDVALGDSRFAIPPKVCSSTHADGIVLFHTGRDIVFRANRTGSRIWQAVARGDRLEAITFDLSRDYSIPEQEARQAAVDFIRELRDLELVILTR